MMDMCAGDEMLGYLVPLCWKVDRVCPLFAVDIRERTGGEVFFVRDNANLRG